MLDAQLLLPLALKNRLLGIISLGPKLSEEPYSDYGHPAVARCGIANRVGAGECPPDREHPAGNCRAGPHESRIGDCARRPGAIVPAVFALCGGLDYAGYCSPQQEVGGDYYDFLLAKGVYFGIAIGDVSGKGIAASLMMASLQASLRTQTLRPSGGPAEIVSLINRLVYDASASNRFATFFYGQYYPETACLPT